MSQDFLTAIKSFSVPLADLMGVEFIKAEPDCVVAQLKVRKELCTVPDILHGGAIMALADTTGAVATAICIPHHKGGRLMVWETRITRSDGRLCAVVTQSQLVMLPKT